MSRYFVLGYSFPGALIYSAIILCSFAGSNPKAGSEKIIQTDSVFTPNASQGWHVYSSYQHPHGDSIRFEMILYRNEPVNNWGDSLRVGTINMEYAPVELQAVEYVEFPRIWRIIIQPQGTCYFQLLSGPNPTGNPIVIPVITNYKK